MQEQEYIITLFGKEARRTFTALYLGGNLNSLTFSKTEEWTGGAIQWTLNFMRSNWNEESLLENVNDLSSTVRFRVAKVEQDLSFESFWEAYGYKVGNKARAAKLWGNMGKQDKQHCFVGIRAYNYYLTLHTNVEKLYPETFLHQRRYENEYKI